MRRRTLAPRVSLRALTMGLAAFALTLGAAAACVELPVVNTDAMGGAAGIDSWGGEGSGDDETTGGSSIGGASIGGSATVGGGGVSGSGGSSNGGSSGTGADGGGSSGGSAGSGGASSGGGSAGRGGTSGGGGKGGTSGSGGKAGSAGSGGKGGAGGSSGASGSGGSAGFSTDRDEFFGDSRCSTEFDLCDDFERTTLDTARWRVQGPAPTIDSTRAARGMRSAHFHTEDNGLSLIHTTSIFPADNNTYWGRMFVYFDTMPTAPMWAHWSVAAAVGSGTEAEIRVGGQYDGEINRFGVGTDHGETGDWTTLDEDTGDAVPVDSWVCVEWLHKGDTNETRFYWDGVELASLHTTASDHGGPQGEEYLLPEFESVYVGWWLYQAGTTPPEFDVWIDEVALDAERIGCSR